MAQGKTLCHFLYKKVENIPFCDKIIISVTERNMKIESNYT